MLKNGMLLLHDPIRVAVRVGGAPVRPERLASIGEMLSKTIARRLMALPPPAGRRSVQDYLIRLGMPRVVVESTRQDLIFEFHDPDLAFGVSRHACAHWFELTAALYAEDYAMLASRTARAAVRLEVPGVFVVLRKRTCRDLVALGGQFFWACRTAPELWGDGSRRALSGLSDRERAHIDQVRRGELTDCAYCAALLGWQQGVAAGVSASTLLDSLPEDRLSDLVRLLARADGGKVLLARVICAAACDPAVASSTLVEALTPWLLPLVRGADVSPSDLGALEAWTARVLECPILVEVIGRLFRGAPNDTTDVLLAWSAQLLARPATRSPFRSLLLATLDDDDSVQPAVRTRLEHLLQIQA